MRSRLQKSSYSAHSFSVISLTAARDRSRRPVLSVKASSMSARRQAPRVEFDRKPLEFPRASRKCRPHARHERFRRIPDLRSRIIHGALRRLHLARPITVAIAGFAVLAALVTFPSKRVADFSI